MTAPATADRPALSHTVELLEVLRLVAPVSGLVCLDCRSLTGLSHEQPALHCPISALPTGLLDLLEKEYAIRFSPALRGSGGDGALTSLSVLAVLWKPAVIFSAATRWRHAIAEEAQERIRQAIGACPLAPTALIDAGPEVVALWALDHTLNLRDSAERDRADRLQRRLAESLCADAAASELGAFVPLCGPIRNWGDPAPVVHLDVEPKRIYRLEDLERALADATAPAVTGQASKRKEIK